MTVRIEPTQGPGRAVSSTRLLGALKYAAGDFIWPAGQSTVDGETVPSVRDPDLVGPLDAFDASYSASSHTVTILPGEAVVGGAYVGSDDETVTDSGGDTVHDVALDASTAGQEVFLGYDHTQQDVDALIIGTASAFTASDQPRVHIWTFDTDGSGVTNAVSYRPLGVRLNRVNRRYEGDGQAVDEAQHASTADYASNAGQVEGRDVYVQSSEPADWDDGDLWFQPQ